MTTSSRGAKLKKFWEEDGVHSVSPGPTFLLVLSLLPPINGKEGGLINFELWLTKRMISHGFRSLLLLLLLLSSLSLVVARSLAP